MRINHNISALNANNQLNRNDSKMSKSLERLTSGLKINNASDDAAGMAISQKMRTQIEGLKKASTNASDGISVIQTAEGALSEVESCLQRMNELSVQAANGTYTLGDRAAIQDEVDALNAEIQRISESTEFNTKQLLDGTIDRKTYSNNTNVSVIAISDEVLSDKYAIKVTEDPRQAVIIGNEMGTGATADKKITKEQAGNISINGSNIEINEGDSYESVYEKIRETASTKSIYAFPSSDTTYDLSKEENIKNAGYSPEAATFTAPQKMMFVSKEYGSSAKIEIVTDNEKLGDLVGISIGNTQAAGKDAKLSVVSNTDGGFSNTASVITSGKKAVITDNDGFSIQINVEPGTSGTTYDDVSVADTVAGTKPSDPVAGTPADVELLVFEAGPMSLHIGANAYQTMIVTIPKVNPETLGVENVNLLTEDDAEKAIAAIADAVETVSSIRGKLGAYQNRLDHAIQNLDTASENITESLSRIEDTDMAEEMANYTQYNVLVQAGTSMLAQANQRPQNVLSLLQ